MNGTLTARPLVRWCTLDIGQRDFRPGMYKANAIWRGNCCLNFGTRGRRDANSTLMGRPYRPVFGASK